MRELGEEGEGDCGGGEELEGWEGEGEEEGERGEEGEGGEEKEKGAGGGGEGDDQERDDHLWSLGESELRSSGWSVLEPEKKKRRTHVLHEEEDVLAVRAPGELVAIVVCDGDGEPGRVEDVATEAQSPRALRSDDLEDLGDFDDGSAGYDSEPEAL